jgi:LPS-assembly lipoprotein
VISRIVHTPPRRRLLAASAALSVATLLGGCGFALRQTPPLPFRRIALSGFADRSPLGDALRQRLTDAAQVVDTPGQAEVVLQVITDKRERSVVASTAAGQVRELQLRVRFEFSLASPGGRNLIPPTELLLTRDMSYSESFALAKAQEEAELMAAMQDDIVQQVLRRLAQANPAGPAAAGTTRP